MINLIIIIVDRYASTIFQNPVIFSIVIHHFRITRFLPYQSSRSNVFRSILPNSIGFIIPYSTDCLTDEPTIRSIILLYTILVIIIVDMVNFILNNRKSYGCKAISKPWFCTSPKLAMMEPKPEKLGKRWLIIMSVVFFK